MIHFRKVVIVIDQRRYMIIAPRLFLKNLCFKEKKYLTLHLLPKIYYFFLPNENETNTNAVGGGRFLCILTAVKQKNVYRNRNKVKQSNAKKLYPCDQETLTGHTSSLKHNLCETQ